jgi:simple sugar transport system substrate-binding protein
MALSSCAPQAEQPVKFLIGVSQANLSEPWRISMTDEIQRQAALHPELRIIVADASDSLGKQIGDVEKFEGLGVDLLIISPLESEAITPTLTRVYQSIPVIVLNRSVDGDDYTLFIGPDNARIGQEAGRFVARTLKVTGGKVLEVLGRSASPPTLERAEAFRQEIAANPLITLQSPVLANWLRDGAEDLVLERLQTDPPPQVIFAHNDAMAYGAWLAAEKLGLAKKITFLGVDGLPGPRGGLEMLRSGILDGTFLSPTGGKEAVAYALALLRHEGEQPKKVILGTRFLSQADLGSSAGVKTVPPDRPRTVGYFASTSQNSWTLSLRDSARAALRKGGWTLVEVGREAKILPSGLDAFVVEDIDRGKEDRLRREAAEAEAVSRSLPLFLIGPQPPSGDDGGWSLALGPDPAEEGRRAGRWLADQNLTRILELIGPRENAGAAEWSEGLSRGLVEREGAPVTLRVLTDGTRNGTREAVARVLASGQNVDSVFAPSDEGILGTLDALRTRRLAPGRDVKIAGVGASPEVFEALKAGLVSCVVRSPSDLGPLLRNDIVQALAEPGVPRRLVTSRDVLTR